jgi:hypothetical protein
VTADTMMTISTIFYGEHRQAAAKFSLNISQLDWLNSTTAMIVLL